MKKISISRSRSGKPCIGVGGGAYSNTFECRFVLRDKKLAPAIFIRRSGHLACSLSQAVVPVEKGDVVIVIRGHLPFERENPDIYVESYMINDIVSEGNNEYALLTEVDFKVPEDVWDFIRRGIKYHNRDGSYFCIPPCF